MAITASIALNQTPIQFNQNSGAQVTVSNSGGAPVTVTGMQAVITPHTNSKSSTLPQGFGQQFTVPASGSVVIPMSYVVFSPEVAPSNSALAAPSGSYLVGCIVYTSDGSVTSPTPAALTVSPLSLPSSEL